jgi:hypothetical protein
MVYFGRADQARDYFLSLGYVPQAERQTTPDFLVSVRVVDLMACAAQADGSRRSPTP